MRKYAVRKDCSGIYLVVNERPPYVELSSPDCGSSWGEREFAPVYNHEFEEGCATVREHVEHVVLFDTIEEAREYSNALHQAEVARFKAKEEKEREELLQALREVGAPPARWEEINYTEYLFVGETRYVYVFPEYHTEILTTAYRGGTKPADPNFGRGGDFDFERATAVKGKKGDVFARLRCCGTFVLVPFERGTDPQEWQQYLGVLVEKGGRVFFRVHKKLWEASDWEKKRWGKICFLTKHLPQQE